MELKSRIPDETTLESLVLSNLSASTQSVKEEVGGIEAEYISYRRKQRLVALSFFLLLILPNIFFFVFGSLLSTSVSAWSGAIGTLIFALSIGVFIYFGAISFVRGAGVVKAFHGQVDKVLFAKVFDILGVRGRLVEHTTKLDERVFPDTKIGKIRQAFSKISPACRAVS